MDAHTASDRKAGVESVQAQERSSSPVSLIVWVGVCLAGVAAAASTYVYVLNTSSYALVHLLTEFTSIAVYTGVFMVAWNTRKTIENGYVLVVALAGVYVAGLDTLHSLTYSGVLPVPTAGADVPEQLWLAARYLQAVSLLVAPAFAGRRVSPVRVMALFGAMAGFSVAAIWWASSASVPASAHVTIGALTDVSEYVIAAALAAALAGLVTRRRAQDAQVFTLMTAAICCLLVAEAALALFPDPYALPNYLGHLLRVAGAVMIYRALVEAAISRPFDVLFREYNAASEALRQSDRRLRTTFEQAILGILEVDPDGRILRANRRLSALTGREHAELIGSPAIELTFAEDRAAESELFAALRAGSINEYRLEKRVCGPGGALTWFSANRSSVVDENGQVEYFIEMLDDITAQRETELRLQRSRDLKAALSTIDLAINSTFDIDRIIETSVTEGALAIGAESAIVVMPDGGSWTVRSAWEFPQDVLGTTLDAATMSDMIRYEPIGLPLAIVDAAADPRISPEMASRFGIASLIVIPLGFRGQELGLLFFNYHSGPRSFAEEEISFVVELSSALTLAIENSRLYEAERKTVDTLHASLLRTESEIPGIEVGAAYYSAVELARIGGDFFDVFELPDHRVGFAVGDVAGKGIEAAAITAIAKSTVRAFAYEWGSPARVVRAANQALSRQIDEARFVTLVYGLLDVTTGETRIVCAGHPSPLICDESGCVEDVSVHNPPLAVFEFMDFEEYRTVLRPNMRLVAFSDGLLDARRGEEFLGEERVRELIDGMGDAAPETLAEELLAAARSHSDGHPPDDIAILAIRFCGLDSGQTTE